MIDLFAGCLDQVGLLEMKSMPNSTNGVIVLSDSFATSIFKQSYLRIFNKDAEGHLEMGFNATFDVQTTKEKDETGECGVTRDRLEPVVRKVEQYHLRMSRVL